MTFFFEDIFSFKSWHQERAKKLIDIVKEYFFLTKFSIEKKNQISPDFIFWDIRKKKYQRREKTVITLILRLRKYFCKQCIMLNIEYWHISGRERDAAN